MGCAAMHRRELGCPRHSRPPRRGRPRWPLQRAGWRRHAAANARWRRWPHRERVHAPGAAVVGDRDLRHGASSPCRYRRKDGPCTGKQLPPLYLLTQEQVAIRQPVEQVHDAGRKRVMQRADSAHHVPASPATTTAGAHHRQDAAQARRAHASGRQSHASDQHSPDTRARCTKLTGSPR